MSKKDKAIFLTYCFSLSQLLIEAIDAIENTSQSLFRQDLKRVAKKFRDELMKRVSVLYENSVNGRMHESEEMEFYDFTNLLELQLHLIMQMNETERKQLAKLLAQVQKRLHSRH